MPRKRIEPIEPIPKEENDIKAVLAKALREGLPGRVIISHQDVYTRNIPDLSVNGEWMTWWLECKHATPNFNDNPTQELMMVRLAHRGYARYIVWLETLRHTRHTLIIHPEEVHRKRGQMNFIEAEQETTGFNHKFVLDYLLRQRSNFTVNVS